MGRGGVSPVTVPQLDIAGPSTMTVTQPDMVGLSSSPATEKEACRMEMGPDTALAEEVLDEKDSPVPIALPSWDEMMEMLKCVPCFTDVEAPSTKMSDFFLLTKRISVNMGGDPPSFVLTQLPFGTPESAVFCI